MINPWMWDVGGGRRDRPARALAFAGGVLPVMTSLPVVLVLSLALFTPGRAVAQSLTATKESPAQKSARPQPIPKAYLPPPGMCRIWVEEG